jgi:DNA recombination protein RmuC
VEVQRLLDDVGRLRERVGKLDTHFRQAQEDVATITISADKVLKRGEKITALELDAPAAVVTAPSDKTSTSDTHGAGVALPFPPR